MSLNERKCFEMLKLVALIINPVIENVKNPLPYDVCPFVFLWYDASVYKPSKLCFMFSTGWESILCMSALLP
jgi:hypothetical protein